MAVSGGLSLAAVLAPRLIILRNIYYAILFNASSVVIVRAAKTASLALLRAYSASSGGAVYRAGGTPSRGRHLSSIFTRCKPLAKAGYSTEAPMIGLSAKGRTAVLGKPAAPTPHCPQTLEEAALFSEGPHFLHASRWSAHKDTRRQSGRFC